MKGTFIIAFLVFSWNKRLETVVKARTAELREANEQLRIRDKMQQDFINIAAHELRTPIQPWFNRVSPITNYRHQTASLVRNHY